MTAHAQVHERHEIGSTRLMPPTPCCNAALPLDQAEVRLTELGLREQDALHEYDFFASARDGEDGGRWQAGVFRVNCVDCLDRTNVAQSVVPRPPDLPPLPCIPPQAARL